jgi:hypothetical protein
MTAISSKVVVGRRHCTMHLDSDGYFNVDWGSERPRSLTSQELNEYLEARNTLIKTMCAELSASGHVDAPYARATW